MYSIEGTANAVPGITEAAICSARTNTYIL